MRRPVEEMATVEFPAADEQPAGSPHRGARSGFWRELSGALTAGVVLLAVVVLVLQVVSWARGMPGPGVPAVIGHLVGGVLAVLAQRVVDRHTGKPALLAGLGVAALAAVALLFFWWS